MSSRLSMTRFLSIFLTLIFLISPFSAFAEEASQVTLKEESIPVYLFVDDSGGILGIAPTDDIFLWAYANPHAVTSIGSLGLSYDQNGNLTTSSDISHFWDYNNRLTKIVAPVPVLDMGMSFGFEFEEIPPPSANYTYDPSGLRITINITDDSGSATTTYPSPYFNTDGATIKEHSNKIG